jgi:hypothetical protein
MVYILEVNPLKPNVPSKGHCQNWYRKRNKILHAKIDIFSVQDDMKEHRVKKKITLKRLSDGSRISDQLFPTNKKIFSALKG